MRCSGVEYDDIAAYFLTPAETPVLDPPVPDTLARRLRDSIESIATVGWWSRSASESASEAGLDFFSAYVWGRAASLGADVSPSVVTSCFGVFESGAIEGVLTAARSAVSHEAILAARQSGAVSGLINATGSIDPLMIESLGSRLLAALKSVDDHGRPLFSGLRALPVPAEPHGTLWRAAELVREHRGDGHLAACVSAGLDAPEMNVMTELWLGFPFGEYSSTRGFSADRLDQAAVRLQGRGWLNAENVLTTEGRRAREDIELATDTSQRALVDELTDDVEWVIASATSTSAAILAARAAPADARKRAAG
jgi:hypothetical protein